VISLQVAILDRFDICIVGAGAIGLAIAYQLASRADGRRLDIVVVEQESDFGQHTSSRNSEVIHAGIYYPTGSLKADLCVRGKHLLYQHCDRFQIPYMQTGKLIIAQADEHRQLEAIRQQAEANGVMDLRWLEKSELESVEPAIVADAALLSPSSGIIDSHAYMQSLLHLSENNGVQFAPYTTVQAVEKNANEFVIHTTIGKQESVTTYKFKSDVLINSAGLNAQALAHTITGLDQASVPPLHLCKGDYFSYQGKSPFQHLVYPLPEANVQGLGIHATLDLSAQLRFGPDAIFVDQIDYDIDASKSALFAEQVSRFFPDISADKLVPAYSGIRPKIVGPGEPAGDFIIQDGNDFGISGLIQLFGIESPGLTASLAIGETVAEIVNKLRQ